MTITTRTAKGSQLSIAEMDANLTDLNAGALVVARPPFTQGGNYTVPDGTAHVVSSATAQVYNTTITFPATPVPGQRLILSNPTAYSMGDVTVVGNGKTILGPSVMSMPAYTSNEWNYNATDGWVPTNRNPMFTEVAIGVNELVGQSAQGGGFRWSLAGGGSADYYIQPGLCWMQTTGSGILGGPNNQMAEFRADNTLDVTDSNVNNGRYSWAGFTANIYNSSIAFGGGATNDAKVNFAIAATSRQNTGASVMAPGTPAGVGVHFSFQNAPLYFGDLTNGLRAQIDTAGNFRTSKMSCDESEVRNTGTASFTVSDNVSTCILAGSGTITLTFPATPVNGQDLTITLETAYTAITLAGNGKTIITGAALGVSAGSFARYRYRAANTTWHRVG